MHNKSINQKKRPKKSNWERCTGAVVHCIHCDFGRDHVNLSGMNPDDERSQQMVYEGVIEKPEESVQHVED